MKLDYVLLGQSKNSQLQNKCFDFKCRHKNKEGNEVGFFNGSYSEIAVSSYPDWTPIEINERGKLMLDFLMKRWDINLNGWEIEKEDFLHLGFLNEEKKK